MISTPKLSDIALILLGLWVVSKLVGTLRQRTKTTKLMGPASQHWLMGVQKYLMNSKDQSLEYEKWADEYGSAYTIPTPLWGQKLVLADPKGIAHFYSRETFGYVQSEMGHTFLKNFIGRGVLWAEGESHRRQRKALTPAFSNAAIRKLTPVFFDSAYKVKDAWDALLDSSGNGECVIDVQEWMNHVSLDSVGIAGFSHNFQTLEGKHSAIGEVFNAMGNAKPSPMHLAIFILSGVFPSFAKVLMSIPTARQALVAKFSDVAEKISGELLERTRKEKEMVEEGKGDHSIIGLLIKSENEKAELRMSEEEVMAQMKVLILAGYETTSISLTWALMNLSKNPGAQDKLREELLSSFSSGDPTYDQLSTGLPYLDAVVHETLRLNPPLPETTRVATEDDIIPLSAPIKAANGQLIDRISIVKGQAVTVPIHTVNKSESIWGSDAHDFKPERWLDQGDGIPEKVKAVQGHRHLLTFVDGPRTCLGKSFALAEFKAVLSTLVRNYTFELRDGPDMKFGMGRSILPRPKVEGEDGCRIPLRIRRVE